MKLLWAIRGKNTETFLTEVERAVFLIGNLNSQEPKDPLTSTYLRIALAQKHIDYKLGDVPPALVAAQALYAAWSAISIRHQKSQANGWESDPHTDFKVQRANDHLFERVYGLLTDDAQEVLAFSIPAIYAAVRCGEDFWKNTVKENTVKILAGNITFWRTGSKNTIRWDKKNRRQLTPRASVVLENSQRIIDFTEITKNAERLSPFAA